MDFFAIDGPDPFHKLFILLIALIIADDQDFEDSLMSPAFIMNKPLWPHQNECLFPALLSTELSCVY